MFAFLRRAFWILLGFVLIVVTVWFAGPYVAFANYYPLEPPLARLVVIGLVVGIWLLFRLMKRLRAFRASDRLLAAVVAQPQPEAAKTPADLVKLRERFEEAVSTLKQQRRTGKSLYDLPWYIIIGAPGSGKTTALLNSGLKFPLEQRVGKGALRGVGGTRNCDWWFADEAIFLDTAGRYTTQDSDAASDAAGWREFLALLKRYRVRRPINGVILTINAEDLIVQGEAARQAHVDAARSRLEELSRELRIQLPVYLMVTKCDLVDGFAEYFDDLSAAGRAQVWGVTFPYDQSLANEGPQVFPADFDALMTRLNEKVFERVEQIRDPRRRTKVFAFPQQMAATRDALTQFVTDVFAGRSDGGIMLRGVYFTSGTQYGTPIDRLLGSIGQRFGTSDAVLPSAGPGKAYFVEQLLKDVMIGESGLAGINRGLEARKAAGQLAAYAAMGLVAIAGVALLTVSYRRNKEYLENTATEVARLDQLGPVPSTAPLDQIVPRLDTVKAIVDSADRYRASNTWAMRWGLYQGRSIYNAAQRAYLSELDSLLLPRVASQIQQRLVQSASRPEAVFLYLKGYLMLSDPKHLEKDYIQELADLDWKPSGVGQSTTGLALSDHLKNLLQNPEPLRPFGVDGTVVNQARASIPQSSWPRILYDEVKRASATRKEGDLRIDQRVGLDVEQVFRRKSGVPLSTPMPRLYTREVFRQITGQGRVDLVTEVTNDGWVWGQDKVASIANASNIVSAVTSLYEQDYIAKWDELLDDLELVPFRTVADANSALRVLTAPTSPLRLLVGMVVANTTLVEPKSAAQQGAIEKAEKKLSDTLGNVLKPLQGVTGPALPPDPGMMVTAHFQPFRQLTVGEDNKTQLDAVIQSISEIQQQLDTLGSGVAEVDVVQILGKPEFRSMLTTLRRQAEDLPHGVRTVVSQVANTSSQIITTVSTSEIERQYADQVVKVCNALIANRYPFTSSGRDVELADFATVFGYGGVFDVFFKEHLVSQVDISSEPWRWREGAITPASGMLDTFQAAQRVRDMFFPPGSKTPSLSFTVMMTDLDSNTTRFVLLIDGQVFDATHQAPVRKLAIWPGTASGSAATHFEARLYDPTKTYGGPWAWFRMIDETRDGPQDAEPVRLNIKNPYHQVHITVETTKAYNNPFANTSWRQFSCGS
jgi:type VI secretion system protein ImpL